MIQKLYGISEFKGIVMVLGNTSSLEAVFSRVRGSNKDYATTYTTCMTSDSAKSNHEALQSNKMCNSSDIGDEIGQSVIGAKLFDLEKTRCSKLMNDWEEKCDPKIKNNTAMKRFEASWNIDFFY
eukprot:10179555-Ditylum_brightwellii.AAC.1